MTITEDLTKRPWQDLRGKRIITNAIVSRVGRIPCNNPPPGFAPGTAGADVVLLVDLRNAAGELILVKVPLASLSRAVVLMERAEQGGAE